MLPVFRNTMPLAATHDGPVNRLETLFDRVFGDDGGLIDRAWPWAPVAMWEDDDHVHVEAELPGVSEDGVDVTVHQDMLFIRAERKPAEGRRYLYNGRAYGRFERAITLPAAVDADSVSAALRDGVLQVDLPKRPDAKPRKIGINAK